MAIRGSIKGKVAINKAEIQKIVDSSVGKVVRKWSTSGTEAMKELRLGAVSKWYGTRAASTMNRSTIFDSKITQSNAKATIAINSYVDPNMFETIRSATPWSVLSWRERHTKPYTYHGIEHPAITMSMSAAEYVIHLQWDLGILGLPERETATGTRWVNPSFQVNPLGSMESYVSKQFTRKKWSTAVKNHLK